MITKRNINKLKKQLDRLGLAEAAGYMDDYRKSNVDTFSAYWSFEKGNDYLSYCVNLERKGNEFAIKNYELHVQSKDIKYSTINGIDTKALETSMRKADELYNQYLDGKYDPSNNHLIEESDQVLKQLFHCGSEGKTIAQNLMFRYWPDIQYKPFIPDDSQLKQAYNLSVTIEIGNGKELNAEQAYQYAKQMNREHILSDDVFKAAHQSFAHGEYFIAYNTIPYFLENSDVYFFKSKDEADEFSANNISEFDDFKVIEASSVDELLKQIPYGEQTRIQLITSKNKIMNEQNFAALEKKLLNLGFKEDFNEAMKKNIEEQKPEFNLQGEMQYGGKAMLVDLGFKAGNENEMYFFNGYKASLKDDPEKTQYFNLDKGNGVTTKEAINLLEGRAVNKDLVNKEGEKYNAWVQLDFEKKLDSGNFDMKRYHTNYNFDLTKAMNEFILKPMTEKEDADLYNSLKKGNVQSVTFLKDGEEVKGFVEANPKERTLNVYDGHMKPISKEQKEELMDIPAGKQQQHKQNVKNNGDDGGDDIELKKKRTRKQGNGMKM